ncbi:carbohydrate kinase [bacterium]|nr:carbohydrate kinase [bacterium]
MYVLGYDVGSSSIKASLLDTGTGDIVASASSPDKELDILAIKPGWAEQHPETWWEHLKNATARMLSRVHVNTRDIRAVGISYQMHGLVVVDKNHRVLRPSIIWCDSRAVETGERAFEDIGKETCLRHFLNSPGNFTASKLKWVKENEPEIYSRIHKAMLPGDYIAMKMSGEIKTTPSGLSEGIMWDFVKEGPADIVLDYYGISKEIISDPVPTFSMQGEMTSDAASELGLHPGTVISYRAGDQPNNALSLNVLNPGEVAATAGTSGVVYGVTDKARYDPRSRVNTFVHVNYAPETPRYGVLLCINGTGILNSWLRHNVMGESSYEEMNDLASQAEPGATGLFILPYGNGAERTLENRDIGAVFTGLKFNTHNRSHYLRAAQEGIVFAMRYGLDITRTMGVEVNKVRAGHANMFLSPLFREVFAAVTESTVELYNTDGSQGAARGAGIGAGIFRNPSDAFAGLKTAEVIEPRSELIERYRDIYQQWRSCLERYIHKI